ncbi:MAG: NCS2 family permease [Pseudomonadota bacterium]
MKDALARYFDLAGRGTSLRTEVVAGLTTFLTMAYIIFVQPQVLGAAGMDPGSVMAATCIAAAAGSLIMGILANYPIGVAPGMGENFFFTYTVVIAMGIAWEKALAIVFISGVVFILLTLFRIREMVINAVPECLKQGIAVGIGLFIAFIGLSEAGLVVANPGGLLKMGALHEGPVILAVFGIFVTAVLVARGVKGAIILGMIATAIVGMATGMLKYGGLISAPPSIAPTFLRMDLAGALHWRYAVPIAIFLYMALFDTIGTLIGVASQAGMMKDGRMPRASRALMADATATTIGAALGTSTTLAYVESIAGVKAGGRTGITAIVVGLLFLAALFFFPLVRTISGGIALPGGAILHPVTAPALVIVGSMMMWGVKNIRWEDYSDAIPAFLTIVAMPFTFSIAQGIAIGFVSYPIIKLSSGKGREVSPLTYILGLLFILKFVFLEN